MKKFFLYINIACYVLIAGFLATTIVTAMQSGYPWTLTCYNCMLCRRICPLGLDPYGFVSAAITNDPDLYIAATNVRMRLGEAYNLDPQMLLRRKDGRTETVRQMLCRGVMHDREITAYKMKVKDAARFCLLCGSCDKACPIKLPVISIVKDLQDDGKFNRK